MITLTTWSGSVLKVKMNKEFFFTVKGLGIFLTYLKGWHRHIVKAPNEEEAKRRMNQFRLSVNPHAK